MENKTFKFKTNINCGGCVSTVTPFLNGVDGITGWEVDTNNKDKILTVVTNTATEQDVMDSVQKAGYTIEPIQN
ncbi:heavy-metal-associated domain-containing protein [Sphingobacterium sp. DN00404]|uniref:Heavy-metal-associated domain-containing protein n=1 Tax=Sphingobacterium micropteri TaxID=2763501 RepID=A0ABR7YNP9_9SPHI|nr:heavy-metal-associated domain-containing protein [Sphingobacterium micropteri]MBD1432948.1 heavy-metal-associated domain-containing protein [Sphingobacterium micropteri]